MSGEPPAWLNDWARFYVPGRKTIAGTSSVYCVGCGRVALGGYSVAIPEDYVFPKRDPDWPFPQDGCPVCTEEIIPGDEQRLAVEIVRGLVASGGVSDLAEVRRRARDWASRNPQP